MKAVRQMKIRQIIEHKAIETQEELAEELRKEGLEVTQATVSRDIKEMRLIKVPVGDNKYRYALPSDYTPINPMNSYERISRMFEDSVVSFDYSENLIVVHTLPGAAQAVAGAIDGVKWREVIGTVAGDDTILLIIKPKEAVAAVLERFQKLMS